MTIRENSRVIHIYSISTAGKCKDKELKVHETWCYTVLHTEARNWLGAIWHCCFCLQDVLNEMQTLKAGHVPTNQTNQKQHLKNAAQENTAKKTPRGMGKEPNVQLKGSLS